MGFCLLFLTPIRLGEEVEHWSSIGGETRVTKNLSISYLYCEVERKEKKGRKKKRKKKEKKAHPEGGFNHQRETFSSLPFTSFL